MDMQNANGPARIIHHEKRGDAMRIHQSQRFRRQRIAANGAGMTRHDLTRRAGKQRRTA